MNKWFSFIIFLLRSVVYIKSNNIDDLIHAPSLKYILFNETCIYMTEASNEINKIKVENDEPHLFSNTSNIKNKTLIKLSEEDFILFALNNISNKITYNKYNIIEDNLINLNFKELDLIIEGHVGNHTIKNIDEDLFLLYYIYNGIFYLQTFNLNNNIKGGNKQMDVESNYMLNTIECDSYDDENIFCVYSVIEISERYNSYTTIVYFSFENINAIKMGKNQIQIDITGPSLIKIENNNKKQFLICYYQIRISNPSIYCQFFIQNNNEILGGQVYFIGTTNSNNNPQLNYADFAFQSLVQLIRYKYTIYIHLKFKKDDKNKESILFISSLDLNLIIPHYFSANTASEKNNILVNDNYILFIVHPYATNNNAKIDFKTLPIKCQNTSLYRLSENNIEINLNKLLDIKNNLNENIFISFYLDPLTYLFINNTRNMGGLLYMYQISEKDKMNNIFSNISLKYNENLKITYNYYIYHDIDNTGNKESPTFSNICLLKILNCYESCLTCHENVIGVDDIHQCSSCKNGYYAFKFNLKDMTFFNCYKKDNPIVQNHYYLDNEQYKECNKSCLSCSNNKNCNKCNEGYFYKEDDFQNDKSNFPCYDTTPPEYYLSITETLKVYKKCYKTCSTCFGEGDPTKNNCIKCKNDFIIYPYDSTKCTTNIEKCQKYWRINETNNIECINDCLDYIITSGTNSNQCVKNCQSYINPLSSWTNHSLLSYMCNREKYCITLELCNIKKWKNNSTTCYSDDIIPNCFEVNDYTPVTDSPITYIPTTIIITTTEMIKEYSTNKYEEPPIQISGKVTIVKNYEFREIKYSSENFTLNQMAKYITELNLELKSHEYIDGIDFITVNRYEDFILTIYPLHMEEYIYYNLIKTNNLSFINFNEFFKGIHYNKQNTDNIIIVCLIEFKNINIPVNSMNYFFFEFNEETNIPIEIKKETLINISSIQLKTEYFLFDYNNTNISEKYSSKLISTIKSLFSLYPDLVFYNETDEFYTDICRTFTSEEGTDMTIVDRIESYSTKISLCENNCQIISLIDKGKKDNPRAYCQCQFKENLEKSINNYSFIYEKIEGNNKPIVHVLKCEKTIFAKGEIENNFAFWIFLLLFIILLIIIFIIIFCYKDSYESNIKPDIKQIKNEDKQSSDNIYNISNKISNDNSEEKYQNLEIKGIKLHSKNNTISLNKISYDAPPKKRKEKNLTKDDNQIGSKSDTNSINTNINFNNKIEFQVKINDEIYDEIFPDYDEVLNNNYYETKYLKNNYINLRMRILKLKKYFSVPITNEDKNKHNNTDIEDNYGDLNNLKNKRKRNTFNYFKTLIPDAELSKGILNEYYETIHWETEYDLKNKKNVLIKSPKVFERSNSFGDENKTIVLLKNRKKKLSIQNKNEFEESKVNEKESIYIHKRKKPFPSSNISSVRSKSISKSVDKFLLNSSNSYIKAGDSFCKVYWLYLNKREFCLTSIINLHDNISSYIRISTFKFVI